MQISIKSDRLSDKKKSTVFYKTLYNLSTPRLTRDSRDGFQYEKKPVLLSEVGKKIY